MTHPAYTHLQDKWSKRQKHVQKRINAKHKSAIEWLQTTGKHAITGSIGSLMLFMLPGSHVHTPSNLLASASPEASQQIDKSAFLITDLKPLLPEDVRPLTPDEEKQISLVLSRSFDLPVKPAINGLRLDRTYGYIGAEQHLARYPGDSMQTHFTTASDAQAFTSSGMAPGLGAWGYFANSEATMTKEDAAREKWYIAVQTFLADDFQNRFGEYRDFFRYRKMLVVNPNNGKAVVADIGDSGPAVWTGKHLGGSPEVMNYLGRVDGAQKGPVLYYFIDDPKNQVPLGPINPVQ